MRNNIVQFIKGVSYNISSITNIYILSKNSLYTYLYILFINITLLYIPNYLYNYYSNSYIKYIYYLWITPVFIFCYIFSLDKFNDLLAFLKDQKTYISIDLNKYIFFFFISTVYYFLINLLYYIPIIGGYIGSILLAHSYGYYCLEYSTFYNNLSPLNKLSIIENNAYFFIGYGTLYSILSLYVSFINLFIIFIVFFPLDIIGMTKLKWIHQIKDTNNNLSRIFLTPIIILNFILKYIVQIYI